jgi:hypothetical protein
MMFWLYVAAAGSGALLGLFSLRVIAVLVGSVVLLATTVAFMTVEQWPLLVAFVNVLLLLTTLQFSYFLALLLPSAPTRVASQDRFDASTRRM